MTIYQNLTDRDLLSLVKYGTPLEGHRPYRVARADGADLVLQASSAADARRTEREYRRRILGEAPLVHGAVVGTYRLGQSGEGVL